MMFEELIKICNPNRVSGDKPKQVNRIVQDSRKVGKGDVFVAVAGERYDGHNFVEAAVAGGALAVVANHSLDIPDPVCIVEVNDTRKILSALALASLDHPEKELQCIGVTGTNGKTTVTTLVYQVLTHLGHKTGLVGTVAKYVGTEQYKTNFTTPDAVELAADLRIMADAGCKYVVLEVSSHALDQYRTDGISFSGAAFTNLTHDHLDYHHSLNEYANAKKRLFDGLNKDAFAVLNEDDTYAQYMSSDCKARIQTFSFNNVNSTCRMLSNNSEGLALDIDGAKITSRLVGRFNAYNLTEAYLIACNLGCPEPASVIGAALGKAQGAPGRLERVQADPHPENAPVIFVDYAHTPDALENVASTLCQIKKKDQRLTIVFGCGGDRDTAKRPIMGAIAERYADHVIITSDNPRFEDPSQIIRDIIVGLKQPENAEVIEDRPKAIQKAIKGNGTKDIVLIAGKGHEDYQEVRGVRHHMDDREIALKAITRQNRSSSKEAG